MKTALYLAVGVAAAAAPALADDNTTDEHHQLDEIIVTATPLRRTVEMLAQPTSVLSGDALTRKQAASIGETIANELGVSATYFGPVASRPVIRGQFGERIDVLSNGLSSLDASALSEDHAVALDNHLAERVEIVRGPATLLYGSGAAGGIVNVIDGRIHEQALDAPVSGTLSLGTDSAIGKTAGSFGIDAGTDNIIGHLDYSRVSTDNIEIPGFAESAALRAAEAEEPGGEAEEEMFGTVENTDSDTEAFGAGFTLLGEKGFLGLSVSTFDTNYGLPGAHEHAEEEPLPPGEEEEEEIIRIDMEQTRYDLRGEWQFGGFIDTVSFRGALNDYQHVELEGPEVGTLYDTQGIDSRLELQHRKIGNVEGVIGMQVKQIDFDAVGEEAFVPPSETTQIGLFAFEEWQVTPSFVLQGSARIENQQIDSPGRVSYDENAFGAAIGAIWNFADAWSLAANLSHAERNPNSTELYADGPHLAVQRFERGSTTQGNGVLEKELSNNLDLTMRADYERLSFNVTGFVNNIDDYIFLQPTAAEEDGLQVFDFTQADARLYGFEAEALFDLYDAPDGTHAHVRVFSDVTRGELRNGGDLPRIPPLRYGVSLHYQRGGIDASIAATRTTEQDRVAENELPTEAFTMIDAEFSYRFANPDVLVFLRGTNLGDEDARRHASPLKDIVPLPGRSLVAGLRWDF